MRFLATVLTGWTGLRVWLLWPMAGSLPVIAHAIAVPVSGPATGPIAGLVLVPMRPDPAALAIPAGAILQGWRGQAPPPGGPRLGGDRARTVGGPVLAATAAHIPSARTAPLGFGDPVPAPLPPVALGLTASGAAHASRLSGSAWLLLRGGPALAAGLAGAQLGGSQAGLRLAYAIDGARRLAITARLSSAIGGSGAGRREGSVGLAWRPTRAPVTLVAEQRFVLDGGHGGPTLGVIAGIGPAPVAAGFRLEAYGQAGGIARSGAAGGLEAFGDGAARLTRPVSVGALHLDLGAGAWGGAQRGARRLDLGPTLGAALPLEGHAFRLAFERRVRVAGNARPGSGPALSLGTDF